MVEEKPIILYDGKIEKATTSQIKSKELEEETKK